MEWERKSNSVQSARETGLGVGVAERSSETRIWKRGICVRSLRGKRMRVLVDQGRREEERGERNTTDGNGEERGGARERDGDWL